VAKRGLVAVLNPHGRCAVSATMVSGARSRRRCGVLSIDDAFERFRQIRGSIAPEDDLPLNEANTRLHLIDPILTDVLGWRRDEMRVELRAGEGFLDYLLKDPEGGRWFVVEAKRRADRLVLDAERDRVERLRFTGPVLSKTFAKIIDEQMSEYIGRYMPAFGMVTNGEQWIGFLARLLPPDCDRIDSSAAVFRSLDAIEADFQRFFELFGVEGARRHTLHRELAPRYRRGIVQGAGARRVVPPEDERPLAFQDRDLAFHEDLRRAMNAAFNPILRDPEALLKCFVESRRSLDADSRLQRMAVELQTVLEDAASRYPERVEEEATLACEPDERSPFDELIGRGCLARVLGEPNAGKSVFLRRLYNAHLARRQTRVLPVWVDGERFVVADSNSVSIEALGDVQSALFSEGVSASAFQAVYPGPWRIGRDEGIDAAAFARERRAFEMDHPLVALGSWLHFAFANRRLLPCIVVDNIDHLDDPAAAVRWAIAVHLRTFALTTVSMQDETLWRLRNRQRDQMPDHGVEQFWLPRPKIHDVLKSRCEYLRAVLSQEPEQKDRARTTLGRRRQIAWTVGADDLVRAVTAVLLDQREVARWIGQICNHDIGRVLELCKRIVLSPHIRAEDLLRSQVTAAPVAIHKVIKAVAAPKTYQFQGLSTDYVMNVFGLWIDHDWAPLLPLRILALLRAREDDDRNRREPQAGFVHQGWLVRLLDHHLAVPPGATRAALEKLATVELVRPYDPSHRGLAGENDRLKITPRGRLHVDWAHNQRTYVHLMAEVDPIIEPDRLDRLVGLREAFFHAMSAQGDVGAAQRAFVSEYARYCLESAARASPLPPGVDELEPIAAYERELAAAWRG